MGFEGVPVFLQAASSLTELIAEAGMLAKTILVVLLVLSVVSWTIIVEKIRYFRKVTRQSAEFRKVFDREGSTGVLRSAAEKLPLSPEAAVLSSLEDSIEKGELRDLKHLDGFMESAMESVVSEWESYLIFLSTTATISPFLGLLGTVWGIMSSFLSMGVRGSANLYVVGPGIADALITTVFGLGAAIPAVIGYNYILRLIRKREEGTGAFLVRLRARMLDGRDGPSERSAPGQGAAAAESSAGRAR